MNHLEVWELERASEDGSKSERAWLRWVDAVEVILGHDLDGNQSLKHGPDDGFCIDYALEAFERGETAAQHASTIKARPAYAEFLARGGAESWKP